MNALYKDAEQAYNSKNFENMLLISENAISINQNDAYAHYLRAVALKELRNVEKAIIAAKAALILDVNASNARLLLASALRELGKIEEAEYEYKFLINEFPNHKIIASNYSFLLNDIKRFEDTVNLLSPFVKDENNLDEAITINIGNAYRGLGDIKSAKKYYKFALEMNGKYLPGVRANLAAIAMEDGQAIDARSTLIQLHENGVAPQEAYLNLAIIDSRSEKNGEAIKWIQLGESMGLDSINAVAIYAFAQAKLGNSKDAIDKIREFTSRHSFDFSLACAWLNIAQKYCLYDDLREVRSKILESIRTEKTVGVSEVNLFSLLACDGIDPWQHLELAKKAASRIVKDRVKLNIKNTKKEKLRVGYLCADFRDHPVAHLMNGVFKNHERKKFEVFGYNIGPFDDSIYRYKSIAYLDHFVEAAELGFEQLAMRIVQDEIDILVDLVGYTENCKPQVLYYKPAPVIISYLGFVGTTGMDVVDYIIADKIVLPKEYESAFTEKPIYLPRCYQATDGTLVIERTTRRELDLPEDKFVFVSLNNGYKLNDRFIAIWAKILEACQNSIIWLYASDDDIKINIKREFNKLGVNEERIYFFKRQTKSKFLGALECADLFLDSSPYNAGTTASDAIYAGCPVVTLPGEIYASRMAASILTNAGLSELVCTSELEYINKSIKIYNDENFRSFIKKKTSESKNTRLFDTKDATRCLEQGYIAAYERFRSELQPDTINISDLGWEKTLHDEKPIADKVFLVEEVALIEKKLKNIYGEYAIKHFQKLIAPISHKSENTKDESMVDSKVKVNNNEIIKIKPNLNESDLVMNNTEEKILNFFNPVFWGVKDPQMFADLMRIAAKQTTGYHFADNMFVFQRNNSMLHDKPFMESWEKNAVSINDKAIIWRRYIKAMAGFHCSHLEGDFVECGAYEGVGAKTVLDYLGGKDFAKTFWLYDLFEHTDEMVNHSMPGHGEHLYDDVCNRFAGYPNVKIFKGFIPDVFSKGIPEKIAYLHIDLNQAPAEIATLEVLFDRVVSGGIIVLDDYEMFYYRAQKHAEDDWLAKRGYKVFPLPTSQGVVIKR